MKRWMLGACSMALAGCAMHAPGSHPVVVTSNPAVVEACRLIGDGGLEAGQFSFILADRRRDDAIRRLKNRTAELGGTHALSSVAELRWKGTDYSAKIYKC